MSRALTIADLRAEAVALRLAWDRRQAESSAGMRCAFPASSQRWLTTTCDMESVCDRALAGDAAAIATAQREIDQRGNWPHNLGECIRWAAGQALAVRDNRIARQDPGVLSAWRAGARD